MFAVVEACALKHAPAASFDPLVRTNARSSLDSEPGCHRLDVASDPVRPEDVVHYELYTDAAAFDAHPKTAHFAEFETATHDVTAWKTVSTYAEVQS